MFRKKFKIKLIRTESCSHKIIFPLSEGNVKLHIKKFCPEKKCFSNLWMKPAWHHDLAPLSRHSSRELQCHIEYSGKQWSGRAQCNNSWILLNRLRDGTYFDQAVHRAEILSRRQLFGATFPTFFPGASVSHLIFRETAESAMPISCEVEIYIVYWLYNPCELDGAISHWYQGYSFIYLTFRLILQHGIVMVLMCSPSTVFPGLEES